jgi:hypothetical protein
MGKLGEMGKLGKLTQNSTLPVPCSLFPVPSPHHNTYSAAPTYAVTDSTKIWHFLEKKNLSREAEVYNQGASTVFSYSMDLIRSGKILSLAD